VRVEGGNVLFYSESNMLDVLLRTQSDIGFIAVSMQIALKIGKEVRGDLM
jgi:hypothetical protein